MVNNGGPAFPRPNSVDGLAKDEAQTGMNVRDWFAGQALVGFISRGIAPDDYPWIADEAFRAADAMVVAREKRA